MSNKAYFEKDVLKRVDELDCKEDMMAIGLLSLSSYSSSARATMLTQHLNQALVPNNPEIPLVCTGYEQMFGEFSSTYKKADHNYKVIKKIIKHPGYVYTLLIYDEKRDFYDIIERNDVCNMAEHYGFQYNNEVIDSISEGDTIKKNTILYRPPAIDKDGNFMYGVNGKVAYVVSQETIEDAVVISESFAKKMAVTKVEDCEVPFNDNDVPLNLYGNNDEYKAFPDVGEKMCNSVLCGMRRRNKAFDQINMKNSNLKKIFPNDEIFQFIGDYTVVDIDIWSNKELDDIPKTNSNKQIIKYYENALRYYSEVYDELSKLIDNDKKYSPNLSRLYAKARDYLDPSCKYADDEKMFSNIIMKFTLKKVSNLVRGCKLAGRYGNKSVISKVLPDEEMGITDDGIIPDVRMDALGVLGRLNDGQCIEQELNWIAELVRNEMKNLTSYDKKISLLLSFYKIVNPDQYQSFSEYIDNIKKNDGKKELHNFIDDIENNKIIIMQSPTDSISGDGLYQLYQKFEPKMLHINYIDDDGENIQSLRTMIVADEYILRLKQEPETKFSARYKSLINPRTFLPIKSTKASKHKTIYSDQSNRVGEQELNVLMLTGDSDALDYFYRSHSSSIDGRRSSVLFENDAFNGFKIDMASDKSCVIDILNAHLKSMGKKLEIDCDDADDDTEDEYDIPAIPKYIKDLYE